MISDVFPRQIPDLFVGRPVILTGRYTGNAPTQLRVTGLAAGQPIELYVAAEPNAQSSHPGLPPVWARGKISDLAEQSLRQPDVEYPQLIKTVALDFSLVSDYTAFVAVDSSAKTAGDPAITVPVAVPVPEGVNYNTTVQEK